MGLLVVALAAAVIGAPPDGGSEIPLRLDRGQEFVYRGIYSETFNRPSAKFSRRYELETYVFVVNQGVGGNNLAFLTVQRAAKQDGQEIPPSARMELGKVDELGRIRFSGKAMRAFVPPEGPPSLEIHAFVELPAGGIKGGATWETTDDGQSALTWGIAGIDKQPCGNCLKLVGRQQSESWKRPAAAGWRREDSVWLKPQGGYAVRIERKWDNRDDGGELGHQSVLVMELETHNPATLPPGEIAARQIEINQTQQFATDFAALLQSPADRNGYATLLSQIQRHLSNRAPTPYREAVLTLRRNIEAARDGERPPEVIAMTNTAARPPADVGAPAPDFLLVDAITGDSGRLSRFQGQPTVLIFFKPSSQMVRHVLEFAQEANSTYAGKVHVAALAVSGEAAAIVQVRSQLAPKLPIYEGRDAIRLFAGESTPRIVILDKSGKVEMILPGWGGEFPRRCSEVLKDLLGP